MSMLDHEPSFLVKILRPNIWEDPLGFAEAASYDFDLPDNPVELLKKVSKKETITETGSYSITVAESTCKRCVLLSICGCMDEAELVRLARKTVLQFIAEEYTLLSSEPMDAESLGIIDHRFIGAFFSFRAPGVERPDCVPTIGSDGFEEDQWLTLAGSADFHDLDAVVNANPFAGRTIFQKIEGACIAVLRELSCREQIRDAVDDKGNVILDEDGYPEIETYIPEQWNTRRKRLVNAAVAVSVELNCIEAAKLFDRLRKYV